MDQQEDLEKWGISSMAWRALTRKRGVMDPWFPFWCTQIPFPFLWSPSLALCFQRFTPLIFLQRTSQTTELLCPQMHREVRRVCINSSRETVCSVTKPWQNIDVRASVSLPQIEIKLGDVTYVLGRSPAGSVWSYPPRDFAWCCSFPFPWERVSLPTPWQVLLGALA